MVVGIDEAWVHDGALGVDRLRGIEAAPQIGVRANLHDARTGDRQRARTVDPALRVHGDDLAVADEDVACALVHMTVLRGVAGQGPPRYRRIILHPVEADRPSPSRLRVTEGSRPDMAAWHCMTECRGAVVGNATVSFAGSFTVSFTEQGLFSRPIHIRPLTCRALVSRESPRRPLIQSCQTSTTINARMGGIAGTQTQHSLNLTAIKVWTWLKSPSLSPDSPQYLVPCQYAPGVD